MKTCQFNGEAFEEARSHPWTEAVGNSNYRYYDFKTSPELIRTSLEDFLPWSAYPAVDLMYRLLERLNAPGFHLETNDCSFSGPDTSEAPDLGRLQCGGRIMLLFRDLRLNLNPLKCPALENDLHRSLTPLDPQFEAGMIGTTLLPVHYRALSEQGLEARGQQLMLSFWAWGDNEQEVMQSLERVLRNLSNALFSPKEVRQEQ